MGLADEVAHRHAASRKGQQRQDELAVELVSAVSGFRTELAQAGQVLAQHGVPQMPVFTTAKGTRLKFSGMHGWLLGRGYQYFLVNGHLAQAHTMPRHPGGMSGHGGYFIPLMTRISLGVSKSSPIVYTYASVDKDQVSYSFGPGKSLQIPLGVDFSYDAYLWLVEAVTNATT